VNVLPVLVAVELNHAPLAPTAATLATTAITITLIRIFFIFLFLLFLFSILIFSLFLIDPRNGYITVPNSYVMPPYGQESLASSLLFSLRFIALIDPQPGEQPFPLKGKALFLPGRTYQPF
jgi:hypothetical protein